MRFPKTGVHRLLFACMVALLSLPARAERVVIEKDSVWPSSGSGYRGPIPPTTRIEVDMNLVETAAPKSSIPEIGVTRTPGASLSFDGIPEVPAIDSIMEKPPDTHIAVGTGAGAAGRIVEVTNNGLAIYDKTGSVVAATTDLDAFFPTTSSGFDPKVIFDQHSSRFFVVTLDGTTPNSGGSGGTSNLHVAYSTSATPGNLTTDWGKVVASALTSIPGDGGGTGAGGAYECWFDYPGIGADSSRLVITGNLFDHLDTGQGSKIRVYDKAALLTGSNSFTDIDNDEFIDPGVSTVQPAHVFGTTDNGNFYLINRVAASAYRLWEIGGTAASPTLVSGTYNTLRAWTAGSLIAAGAPQSGVTGITIDTVSPRIIQAVYRSGSIWCALSADTDADSKTECVWFEIHTNGGNPTTPTVAQSGAINGSDGNEWTFLPAISVNSSNDVVICYGQSFSDQFVDMRAVARDSTDVSGTFQTSVVLKTSAGEYDDFSADNPERWGDYAGCVVDPDDDTTFWVAHEYVKTARSTGNDARWGTWIAKLGNVTPVPVELSGFSIK